MVQDLVKKCLAFATSIHRTNKGIIGATSEKLVGIGAVGQTMGQVNALRSVVMESIMSPEEVCVHFLSDQITTFVNFSPPEVKSRSKANAG